MEPLNITDDKCRECLEELKAASEPIVAAELGRRLKLHGCRETQRREVRAIVEYLRGQGAKIVAANPAGYWLTEDEETWREYQEKRAVDGKRILAEVSRRKKFMSVKGQGLLFAPAVSYGVA